MRKLLVFISVVLISLLIGQSVTFAITPKELIDKVTSKTKDIKDSVIEISMSMSLIGASSESGQTSSTKLSYRLKIESMVSPQIVRIAYIEPEAFKGTVMVIDSGKKLLSMYSPMTNQVVQSKIENAQNTSSIDLSSLNNIFQELEKTYNLTVEEKKLGKKEVYVLTATLKSNQKGDFGKGIFYLDKEAFEPIKIELYDTKNQPMTSIEILSLKYNTGLKVSNLTSFPKGAKIVKGGTIQGPLGLPFSTPQK